MTDLKPPCLGGMVILELVGFLDSWGESSESTVADGILLALNKETQVQDAPSTIFGFLSI